MHVICHATYALTFFLNARNCPHARAARLQDNGPAWSALRTLADGTLDMLEELYKASLDEAPVPFAIPQIPTPCTPNGGNPLRPTPLCPGVGTRAPMPRHQ